ncbi:MAG: hypothetical protein K5660_02665 [Paludibacteraceae bacterium]|nr:hypothetical protein [Paludibacteraceae bacterium]
MYDWKELIRWSLKRWYVYALCVTVCVITGLIHYRYSPSTFNVRASLMLRQLSAYNTQDQLMGKMGFGSDQSTIDEVEVLSSSLLMEQVVEQLHLNTLYYKRDNHHWVNLYPEAPFSLTFPADCQGVQAILKVKDGEYTLTVKDGNRKKSEASLSDASQPFKMHIGDVRMAVTGDIKDGKYRIDYRTTEWAVQEFRERVSVSRSSRESRIIHIGSTTADAPLMRDVISTMLNIYHHGSASDKNILAKETEVFLRERIAAVESELDSAEATLESYKRAHHIANLNAAAESYRSNNDIYEQKVAQLDAELSVLDFMASRLNAMGDNYTVLPANMGITDNALSELVSIYNRHVLNREKLLQTALPGNPQLESLTEQVSHTRRELLSAIEQSRQSTILTRDNTRKQRDLYAARLQATPEQERRYQEMLREKDAKEKQYLFLIESREANSLVLASEAIPVKIIEQPTINPKRVSPKLPPILLMAVLIGLILPALWFFMMELKTVLSTPASSAISTEQTKTDAE